MSRAPDRREFLKQAGACAAGGILTPASSAGVKPAPMTFGFSLYGMRSLSLATALETCSKIGYDAVELAVMPDWPADPKRLGADDRRRVREQIQSHKLPLPALMENTPLDRDDAAHRAQLDRLKAAAELGHDLSPQKPPLIETILGGKPGQWDELKKTFADRLGDWAQLAEKAKTVIAVKPHRSGAMNLPEHALWLLDQVGSPWLQLVYDYSHYEHRDLTMADTLRALAGRTRFVHVKDVKLDKGQAQFLLPGDGTTDYAALFKELKAAGYGGCVCVEVSGQIHGRKDYDPVAAARRCYANLAPAFEKAGVRR
jgi:inosose dehydratase